MVIVALCGGGIGRKVSRRGGWSYKLRGEPSGRSTMELS